MVAINHNTIAAAQMLRKDLIKEAKDAHLILLGPEQFLLGQFDLSVLRDSVFRANLIRAGVDEVHVVNVWEESFRLAYAQVRYLWARLPSGVPIVCASATI